MYLVRRYFKIRYVFFIYLRRHMMEILILFETTLGTSQYLLCNTKLIFQTRKDTEPSYGKVLR